MSPRSCVCSPHPCGRPPVPWHLCCLAAALCRVLPWFPLVVSWPLPGTPTLQRLLLSPLGWLPLYPTGQAPSPPTARSWGGLAWSSPVPAPGSGSWSSAHPSVRGRSPRSCPEPPSLSSPSILPPLATRPSVPSMLVLTLAPVPPFSPPPINQEEAWEALSAPQNEPQPLRLAGAWHWKWRRLQQRLLPAPNHHLVPAAVLPWQPGCCVWGQSALKDGERA